jgi:thiol-disulfide isomerase/thioredoxin
MVKGILLMKKFFKELIGLIILVFIVTNVLNLLRTPNIETNYHDKKVQILYFYTKWCKICKMEKPEIDAISKSFIVERVDAEVKKDLAKSFKLKGYPTIVYLKAGKVLFVDIGYTSRVSIWLKYQVLRMIK